MSNEIATYSMILSKLSLGKSGTECPTKTQILAINSLIVIDNASTYGANECVKIDDIRKGYTPPADNYVFTWDDGSTSDVSANFPWDFSANGTAANIPVISTKNGSSQSWSVSSKPSWITTSTTSSKVTISASDNSGSARSGEVVLTQSGSGKTLTVNVSQAAYSATVEWRYKFGFNNGARDNISVAIRDMREADISSAPSNQREGK